MTFASTALIGEAFVGEGANAAHTNIVLGRRGGPVEAAWATALATPSAGHVPFVTEAFANQRLAAAQAIRAAVLGTPHVADVLDTARAGAANPFYPPPRAVLDRTEPAVAR